MAPHHLTSNTNYASIREYCDNVCVELASVVEHLPGVWNAASELLLHLRDA